MNVIRLTSTKTLPVLAAALESREFKQIELAQTTKISLGRVNKIITWLVHKQIVIKRKGRYQLTQPNRLIDIIASQQNITQTQTFNVQGTKKELLKTLKKKGLLCLGSAHEQYSDYEQDNIEMIENQELLTHLNTLQRGSQSITLYNYDTYIQNKKTKTTTQISTLIDLTALGRTKIIQREGMKLWGTRQ